MFDCIKDDGSGYVIVLNKPHTFHLTGDSACISGCGGTLNQTCTTACQRVLDSDFKDTHEAWGMKAGLEWLTCPHGKFDANKTLGSKCMKGKKHAWDLVSHASTQLDNQNLILQST